MHKIEKFRVRIRGHLKIFSYESQEDLVAGTNATLLFDDHNAIDPENFALLVARGLGDQPDSSIYAMWFGDGGATIDPLGNVILNPPLTTGNADLYDPLYSEIVDQNLGAPAGNSETYTHVAGTTETTVVISCIIPKNEPFNTTQNSFTFSEIGLKTQDGLLLTHVTFTPITKIPSRIIQIVYDILITLDIPAQPQQVLLIGQQATTGCGHFTDRIDENVHLMGVLAGSEAGSLKMTVLFHLIGEEVTSAAGTITPNIT